MASRANLAKIHIAKKELNLDDDTYRDILHLQFGKKSSADLSDVQCVKLLQHFSTLSWKPKSSPPSSKEGRRGGKHGKKPHYMSKSEYLKKIEALLAEAKRSWAYADAMANHMYKIERVQWLTDSQLRGVMVALVKNARREGRRTE